MIYNYTTKCQSDRYEEPFPFPESTPQISISRPVPYLSHTPLHPNRHTYLVRATAYRTPTQRKRPSYRTPTQRKRPSYRTPNQRKHPSLYSFHAVSLLLFRSSPSPPRHGPASRTRTLTHSRAIIRASWGLARASRAPERREDSGVESR